MNGKDIGIKSYMNLAEPICHGQFKWINASEWPCHSLMGILIVDIYRYIYIYIYIHIYAYLNKYIYIYITNMNPYEWVDDHPPT